MTKWDAEYIFRKQLGCNSKNSDICYRMNECSDCDCFVDLVTANKALEFAIGYFHDNAWHTLDEIPKERSWILVKYAWAMDGDFKYGYEAKFHSTGCVSMRNRNAMPTGWKYCDGEEQR